MSTSAIRAGAAYIELMLRDKVTAGLKSASKTLNTFGKDVTTVGTRLMGLGAAITAPLIAASTAFATTAGDLDDMSQRTGMSTEGLSELGYAATMTGATTEDLEKSIRKMNVSLADAAGGSETANAALAAIGLTTQQLAGMSPDEQFEAIAVAIGGVADPAKRAGLAMDVFGKSGAMLVPLMNEGAEGMAKLRQEARDLGLSMSGEDAKAGAAFGDSIDRVKKALFGLTNVIGAAVMPVLADITERVTKAVTWAIAWAKANKELIVTVLKVGAGLAVAGAAIVAIGAAITGLGSVFGVLATVSGMVASAVGMIGTVLAALLSPIGLVISGVAAIGGGLLYMSGAGGAALEWLSEAFGTLKDDALAAWKGIGDALASGNIALAAKILWLTLKVEWQRGINELNKLWSTAKTYALTLWSDTVFGIVRLFNDAWFDIESGLANALSGMTQLLDDFLSSAGRAWDRIVGGTAKAFTDSRMDLTDKEKEDIKAEIDYQTNSKTGDSTTEQAERKTKRDAALVTETAVIEGKRTKSNGRNSHISMPQPCYIASLAQLGCGTG